LVEARVGVTPMGNIVRLAGTMELGGIDSIINQRRVAGFLKSIETYFPDYSYDKLKELRAWVGLRPCSPDGLPFLGRCRRFKNVTVATGHGMLGFTLGPVTGKLVAEVIQAKKTTIPIDGLSLYRF
jgi:D-amino-acid dehydrogenase